MNMLELMNAGVKAIWIALSTTALASCVVPFLHELSEHGRHCHKPRYPALMVLYVYFHCIAYNIDIDM